MKFAERVNPVTGGMEPQTDGTLESPWQQGAEGARRDNR